MELVFVAASFIFLSFLVMTLWQSSIAGVSQNRKIEAERELVKSLYASCMGGSDAMFARFHTQMSRMVAKK